MKIILICRPNYSKTQQRSAFCEIILIPSNFLLIKSLIKKDIEII